MLVVNSCQYSQLLDDDKDRTTDRDEDLTHDLISDAHIRLSEIDHQSLGENVQGNRDVQKPLVATSLSDGPSNRQQEDTRDDIESVTDVSGLGNSQVIHNL